MTDDWLGKRIKKQAERFEIQTKTYESPLFLNTREDLAHFFRKDKKNFFQTTFYKQQRKKRNVLLVKDDEPVGGKWSFDAENRKKYSTKKTPPEIQFPDENSFWNEAVSYTNKLFKKNPEEPLHRPYILSRLMRRKHAFISSLKPVFKLSVIMKMPSFWKGPFYITVFFLH